MKVHSYMVIQHEFIHEKLNSFRTRIHLGIRIPFNFEKAPFHSYDVKHTLQFEKKGCKRNGNAYEKYVNAKQICFSLILTIHFE